MTSSHKTIDVKKVDNRVKNVKLTFNTIRIYTILLSYLPTIILLSTHSDDKYL